MSEAVRVSGEAAEVARAEAQAVHPLAVHFCTERCKDKYMRKLFDYDVVA